MAVTRFQALLAFGKQ